MKKRAHDFFIIHIYFIDKIWLFKKNYSNQHDIVAEKNWFDGQIDANAGVIVPLLGNEYSPEALVEIGIQGLTSSEVSGFGRQKGHTEIYRGAEYAINFVPKNKIEVAVSDGQVDAAINAIKSAANTDNIGDGKIFVLDMGQAVRIRTGETGEEAL